MKITKYGHACLMVEIDGRSLVIDPGVFSTDFVSPDNVDAVVIVIVRVWDADARIIRAAHIFRAARILR